ncbi:TIR domain-containing protein [bacterium]|nr:TIR domain-containing protein [bacterium]
MRVTIAGSLAPRFFVSYSRRQSALAAELRSLLAADAQAVWFDIDAITIGDDWRAEILAGVRECDELVLLASDDSLASAVVAEEVAAAEEAGKTIRPIVVAPLSAPLPPSLQRLHHIDMSRATEEERKRLLAAVFQPAAGSGSAASGTTASGGVLSPAQTLKIEACRGVHPAFDLRLIEPAGLPEASARAAALEALRARYGAASAIWLNAGLWRCCSGDWTGGLGVLRAHAAAAGTFAGWYFLALHLLRREPASRAPADRIREAAGALQQAERIGENPLAHLLAAVIAVGGQNAGPAVLDRRIEAFAAAHAAQPEAPLEYVRLFWALQPSAASFGRHEPAIRRLIRELV